MDIDAGLMQDDALDAWISTPLHTTIHHHQAKPSADIQSTVGLGQNGVAEYLDG